MGKDRFEKVYSQGKINATEIWVDKETGVNYVFHYYGHAPDLRLYLTEKENLLFLQL
ncbi:xylan 1,4-beta-xylosidase [Clostridioides difficile]|nr:xylan 1,4-beta-xylosidase [Clostridioides difficile]